MPVPRAVFEQIRRLIPPLDGSLHKGQSGRVGVLGGALDYTGAPFFAAISALRFGADLSHVICSPVAAGAIKSYSPDLIVHPILKPDNSAYSEIDDVFSRLHVVVMGPGLGREPYMQDHFFSALEMARKRGLFVVLDADALWAVTTRPSAIKGYRRAVLTPNIVEFKRLYEGVVGRPDADEGQKAALLSKALGGVTILQKGATDIIAVYTTGHPDLKPSNIKGDVKLEQAGEIIGVDAEGGLKRCGGQGDILSGTVGTMLAWGKCYEDGAFGDKSLPVSRIPILAAIGGSMVTRTASKRAFSKQGRAVVTEDMIPEVGKAFAEIFGSEAQDQDRGKL